ncbi:MAG: phage shock protein operon transcriptional activator [Congregibacter sp.]
MKANVDNMLGESLALNKALDHLSLLAAVERPVLVMGERGTGKELAAERLHYLSQRWDGPFIKVNCAAMADTLLESELFGHEAGAFTGATKQHIGRFERAHEGTLFLDEIGTTSPRLQEKLLRLIEYGEFERVGGNKTLSVDVRVIGATNADLSAMAQAGEFRADLLDRLSFDVVHMPPLHQREDDCVLLANHFAVKMSGELGWDYFPGFSARALASLRTYRWPGNVRELKNAVERSLHRHGDPDSEVDSLVIDPFTPPWQSQRSAPQGRTAKHNKTPGFTDEAAPKQPEEANRPLQDQVAELERSLIQAALEKHANHQGRTAQFLGLSYDQLRGLMRKHKLQKTRRKA